jgi:hypothetical protein
MKFWGKIESLLEQQYDTTMVDDFPTIVAVYHEFESDYNSTIHAVYICTLITVTMSTA